MFEFMSLINISFLFCNVIEHSVAHLLHWDSYGETGLLLTHLLSLLKRAGKVDLI